jgi:hypothetical protein
LADDALRPRLLKRLKDARRKLPRDFSFGTGLTVPSGLKRGMLPEGMENLYVWRKIKGLSMKTGIRRRCR